MGDRAAELFPIPPRDQVVALPGMALTDVHRAALDIEDCFAPGRAGDPDVRVVSYRPRNLDGPLPLLVHFHGGAFCFLSAESFAAKDADNAMRLRCVVAAVDYRLAPEHPFPAAPEDCYSALCWAVSAFNVDRDRVVVMGGSAGGALAAAVTLMARDRGGPAVHHQVLYVPVLDDRLQTASMRNGDVAEGFNRTRAEGMWLHYLGEDYNRAVTSPYAAPARAKTLAGLPPAYIRVNGLDPLRDEGIEYAMRLMHGGVAVELYCVPGLYHADEPRDAGLALKVSSSEEQAIAAAFAG